MSRQPIVERLSRCERLGYLLTDGSPDLNRLYLEATWDVATRTWVLSC
ncbi:hypothetical protein [Streptoalloteichus tenebrarius]|nr:hypothetical protein [Streptoalloteichus tenebrarius]BFF00907.1 hypothetical protein GCM10020241_25820 [Streptoalloteichus tenebrarius]